MLAYLAPAAFRPASILLVAGVLAGCAGEPPGATAVPQAPGPSSSIAVPAGAQVFDVDASRTKMTALVYRAGPLARLGHNHAIVSGQESGVVWLGANPA